MGKEEKKFQLKPKRFEFTFEYEYSDGKKEDIVFMHPTDEIEKNPLSEEETKNGSVLMRDIFAGALKKCIRCKDMDAFIKDVTSTGTAEDVFKALREESGKLKARG